MFEVVIRPGALRQLKRLRRHDAATILDAMERYLRHEPERTSRSRIKRLRGTQDATFRLRVGDYRVYYDVREQTVSVVAVLHKRETATFYRQE
jgi:mRNA-degrading endonuclease RelE of RelBE toxin-antitoxin system